MMAFHFGYGSDDRSDIQHLYATHSIEQTLLIYDRVFSFDPADTRLIRIGTMAFQFSRRMPLQGPSPGQ
jgi:ABC-type taurine transport system ATPase subunit